MWDQNHVVLIPSLVDFTEEPCMILIGSNLRNVLIPMLTLCRDDKNLS